MPPKSLAQRQFDEFADALAIVRPDWAKTTRRAQWEHDVLAIAEAFQEVNPDFDREKFMGACTARKGLMRFPCGVNSSLQSRKRD